MKPNPRTVLFLHPSAELYGADRTLLDLATSLDRGLHTPVVALPRRGPLADALEDAGVSVEIGPLGIGSRARMTPLGVPGLLWSLLPAIRFVRRMVRKHDAAIVHTNTMIVLGGALGAKLSKARHVWHVHEILHRPRMLARAFAWTFRLLSDRVVTNSAATAECFVRWCGSLATRQETIPNGLHPDRVSDPHQDADTVRAQLGMEPGQPLVLLIGRINSWKGQGLLLEAACALRATHPTARYVLVGDAPPGQDHFDALLRASITKAGLEDVVLRLPFTQDVASLVHAADIAVVPSTRPEPFGLVALEAMAAGTPVVAANHGGVTEVVRHGETGLLVEPCDAGTLAEALDALLSDPDKARAMGAAGRERQREAFTLDAHRRAFEDLYRRTMLDIDFAPVEAERPDVVHVVLGKANPRRMNGVNQVVHHLAQAQVRAGRWVEVWGLTRDPEAPTPPRSYKLKLFPHSGRRWNLHASLTFAAKHLPRTTFHLHGGMLIEWWALSRVLERAGHRVVLTPHGAWRPDALQHRARTKALFIAFFERATIDRLDAIQAFTQAGADEIARFAPYTPIATVPNGQDPLTEGDLPKPRREHPLLAFCGRMTTFTKGLDLLLDGMAEHVLRDGTCELEMIGDGDDRAALEARVRELGLEDRVRFLGADYDSAKRERLASADAFVHPSRHEGMPTSVLEAGALGLPLVLTRETRVADEVRETDAGWILESATGSALANVLDQLQAEFESDDLQARGARARALVTDSFSWDAVAPRIEAELYGTAIAGVEAGTSVPHPSISHPSPPPPFPDSVLAPRETRNDNARSA